eukprot:4259719-Prymnesium_polylepis.1
MVALDTLAWLSLPQHTGGNSRHRQWVSEAPEAVSQLWHGRRSPWALIGMILEATELLETWGNSA